MRLPVGIFALPPGLVLVLLLVLVPALAGCSTWVPAAALAGANAISLVGNDRTVSDSMVSSLTGKACSVVNLGLQKPYCQEKEVPVRPMPWCTRSLGTSDCWAAPEALPRGTPFVADAPDLTAAQVQNLRGTWLERQFGL